MGAHQAPGSLGFSRREHWSGLPFPSPMHESEKWKWSHSVVSDSSWSHGLQPTRLLFPWDFPGKSTGVGCHCLLCCNTSGDMQLSLQMQTPSPACSWRILDYIRKHTNCLTPSTWRGLELRLLAQDWSSHNCVASLLPLNFFATKKPMTKAAGAFPVRLYIRTFLLFSFLAPCWLDPKAWFCCASRCLLLAGAQSPGWSTIIFSCANPSHPGKDSWPVSNK